MKKLPPLNQIKVSKKTIYIAGPVSGHDPGEVSTNFAAAERKLRSEAYEVINPVKLIQSMNDQRIRTGLPKLTDENDRREILGICLNNLFAADEVYLLHGWAGSKGARLEVHIAKELGMKFRNEFGEVSSDYINDQHGTKQTIGGWIALSTRMPDHLKAIWISDGKGTTTLGCRIVEGDSWCWGVCKGDIYEADEEIIVECEIQEIDVVVWHEVPMPPKFVRVKLF